jgi:hypothetical protein
MQIQSLLLYQLSYTPSVQAVGAGARGRAYRLEAGCSSIELHPQCLSYGPLGRTRTCMPVGTWF